MFDPQRNTVEDATSQISRMIAKGLSQYGNARIRIGDLNDEFTRAIYHFARTIGPEGQLAMLSRNPALMEMQATALAGPATVSGIVEKCLFDALNTRLRPKLVDMSFKLREGLISQTASDVADFVSHVYITAPELVSADAVDQVLRFAHSPEDTDLPDAFSGELPQMFARLRARRKDAGLFQSLGVEPRALTAIEDSAFEIAWLAREDAERFRMAAVEEKRSVPAPSMSMAA